MFPFNFLSPGYALLAKIFTGILLVIAIMFAWHYYVASPYIEKGRAEQRAEDQKEFNNINNELAAQKAAANAKYRDATAALLEAINQRDKFKAKLGEQYVTNQTTTNRLAAAYSAYSLRFTAETARCGDRSGCSDIPKGNATSVAGTTTIQLPESISRNLFALALEADRLNDNYKLCRAWVYR